MPASKKSLYIAEQSILKFCAVHRSVFYWTFTFADNLGDKAIAQKRFRPFVDLIRRRGGEFLVFWEKQSRGAWHVHLLTDLYLDVVWLRQWMVERGWGQQMYVKRVEKKSSYIPGKGWVSDDREIRKLVWYLRKYLTKSLEESEGKSKGFGGTAISKVGTTRFKWMPSVNPYSYLYYYGARAMMEIFQEIPNWLTVSFCIRLGAEYCNWREIDPFFIPP